MSSRLAVAIVTMISGFAIGSAALGQTSDVPKSGGTLVVALHRQAECIDPQQDNYGYGSNEGRLLVDSLTDQSYEEPNKIVPWLAESWTVNEDATQYEFKLRSGVTFSDGTKFDAQIVKDNFETLAKIAGAAGRAYLEGIKTIAVVDPVTLRIEFTSPNVPFLQATSTAELGIVSRATLAKTADQRCAAGVIGTGSFFTEKYKYNEETILAKRADYKWASSLRKHQGAPYLDKVVFKMVPEASVRTGALTSRQVDLIQYVSFQDANALKKAGFTVTESEALGLAVNLVINTSRPILGEKAVRRALQHGINRQEVIDLAFSGYMTPGRGVLTPTAPNFIDQSASLKHDPVLAKKILDEAGWKVGSGGVRQKDGKPLLITASFRAGAINQSFLEVVQQQVREIGIDFRLRPLTGGAFDEALLAGNYDLHRWTWFRADPDVIRSVYSTKTLNRFRLPPENKIDGLLDAQRATPDQKERAKLTAEVQKIIIDESYVIPVFNNVVLWAQSQRVKDVAFGPGGSGGPNLLLHDAWLSD